MRTPSKAVQLVAVVFALSASAAVAEGSCGAARSAMERMTCVDPVMAARDAAMTQLYRADGGASLQAQRRWLAGALACRDAACLQQRYDARNGTLLQQDGGRRLARRYHLETKDRNGDLLILQRGGWLTYDATETVIGPGGESAGDVSAASLQGTVRLVGAVARETKRGGCEATLQRNPDASWSMATRHCFEGDRADLNDRFLPTR